MADTYVERECVNCGSGPDGHRTVITTTVSHNCHLRGDRIRTVACERCGLVFLNPAPTSEAVARLYRHDLYQRPKRPKTNPARTGEAGQVTKQHLYDFLRQAHGRLQGLAVLDIGCGNGRWLARFDASNELHGVELSPMAKHGVEERLRIHQAEFMEFEPPGRPFDLITATALIEHLRDPLAALVRMNRLMQTGGCLFLYTPDVHALGLQRGSDKYFKIVHLYYFSVATLSSPLQKAGFAVQAVRRYPLVRSSLFAPDRQVVGTFALLACKQKGVGLEEARGCPPTTGREEYVAACQAIERARARDRLCAALARLRRMVR